MENNNLNNNPMKVKCVLSSLGILFAGTLMAQEAQPQPESSLWMFSNPLFNVLLGVIILLIIAISVLGGVLKNVAEATKDKNRNSGKILSVIALIAFLSVGKNANAQEAVASASSNYMGLGTSLFYFLIGVIVFELIIVMVLINMIQLFIRKEETAKAVAAKKAEPSLLEKLNASVAIEKEHDILLDHNYDGIRELDNDLPPWWKYGFYFTIVVGVIYLINFHVIGTGDLQIAEYNKSVIAAHEAKEAYEKTMANNVTEANVKMITDKHELMEAENTFKENCAVCHGKKAEGGVGPNLTDEYWLHGGSIVDVFKTIKYGWPDKGMKSWQADFPPLKINELASYVKTLRGTNPPNPKAPQGDLFVESGAIKSDSTKTTTDSTAVLVKTDSVKVAIGK